MPQFSLLARIQNPIFSVLSALVDSLKAQTNPDWELVAVVDHSRTADWTLLQALTAAEPRVRAIFVPDSELLAWVANGQTASLGDWLMFVDQHDHLVPTALAQLAAAATAAPAARVLYGDECYRDGSGRRSFITRKGQLDPTRLLAQEHIGAPAAIQVAYLQASGGFDRLASDVPTHDLYLRWVEALGEAGFVYVPEVLIEHHRTYLAPANPDIRRQPHLVRYDLYALRQALTRRSLNAEVIQLVGTARINFRPTTKLPCSIVLLVGDDTPAGFERIHALNRTLTSTPVNVTVVQRGSHAGAAQDYLEICRALGWKHQLTGQTVPAFLHDYLATATTEWICVLDGLALNWGWLDQLMRHAQSLGAGAAGARTTTPRQLTVPGLPGYRYEGWDWNTRGRFNHLQVAHQTTGLGNACLVFSQHLARQVGGIRPDLPSLWALDLTRRLDQANYRLLSVPYAHIQVASASPTDPTESLLFQAAHPVWEDRYGLQLPL